MFANSLSKVCHLVAKRMSSSFLKKKQDSFHIVFLCRTVLPPTVELKVIDDVF